MSSIDNLKRGARHDLRNLMECRDCGLFQRVVPAGAGDVAACRRCHAVLRKTHDNTAALACACVAALLFTFSLDEPLLTLRARGRLSTGTTFTGPEVLEHFGLEAVAGLVLLTLVIAPAVKIGALLTALAGERSPHPPKWLPWVFGWVERLSPWAMVDVFLLGTFVAYTRLRALASVEIGPALIALGGVMLTTIAIDATIDRHAIWDSFERRGLHARVPARAHGVLIGCHVCGRVSQTTDGAACPRCRHPLRRRKPHSIERAWAFLIAALFLYLPANALPIMTVTRLGQGGSHTILGGVLELYEDHLWPLALIVLVASAIVPVAKLGALAVMLVSVHRRSLAHLLLRTRVFRVIAVIGRWSMIDIFALSTLVALVRLGYLGKVLPGDAALAFAGVVVLTMLATECFDPRLMWDAEKPSGRAPRPILAAVHSVGAAS